MSPLPPPLSGLLLLDKPAGITSARAVHRVKRLLPRGTKIGHAGTLDPFATGLLILLIGKATRRCEELMGAAKSYETTVKLGAVTATDDVESPEERFGPAGATAAPPTEDRIDSTLRTFVGAIEQIPPRYSAIKLAGRRACDRVRAGQQVELKPRTVRVDRIERVAFEWPLLRLRIDCGRGTYIRSIARDLGAALGVGGYLVELRRTRIGGHCVEDAVRLDQLDEAMIANLATAPPPAYFDAAGR